MSQLLTLFKHSQIFFLYFLTIGITYLYSSLKILPTKISKVFLILYNLTNSFSNLYIVLGLQTYILNNHLGFNFKLNDDVKYFIYLHYLTKYMDFVDTIIMILKHNWHQVHLLQLFHHSTIGVIWSWVYYTTPDISATVAFGAFVNSFIHFLMYLHYFVTCIGIKNPLKKYMTILQMFQFFICLLHSLYIIIMIPELYIFAYVQTFYMISMLVLFKIYVYKKNKKIT